MARRITLMSALTALIFYVWYTARPKMPLFPDAERTRLRAFWNENGRYRATLPPDATKKGVWQTRLTPEGSLWLWKYQNALGLGKVAPTQDATGNNEWDTWIKRKIDYDNWLAQNAANAANQALKEQPQPIALREAPPLPGTIPSTLLQAVGNPPTFANIVTPLQHTIAFEDGDLYSFQDNIAIRPTYAYYRFPQGVVSYGASLKKMTDAELQPIFEGAGMNPSEQKIAKAVSRLEGGLDSINTYDTGFVSVGFIQFITAEDGRGSLATVLQQEKTDNPAAYTKDFTQYGIDITPEGVLAVVDPGTGAEIVGNEAVLKVIQDKRLTAVFQRAGRHSLAFRIAQVKVAKSRYWPTEDPVSFTINNQIIACKVSDIIKSEAGIATLFDRKVNRGNINPFAEAVAKVMALHQLTTLDQLAPYEREIIQALKYREDFLLDPILGQPI